MIEIATSLWFGRLTMSAPRNDKMKQERLIMEKKFTPIADSTLPSSEDPQILEEIVVEELSIDGVCGVY
jgi:mycofactocin precursor